MPLKFCQFSQHVVRFYGITRSKLHSKTANVFVSMEKHSSCIIFVRTCANNMLNMKNLSGNECYIRMNFVSLRCDSNKLCATKTEKFNIS